MRARFHTNCRRCGREIRPGQAIVIPKSGRAIHAGCFPDPAGSRPQQREFPELRAAKLAACERAGWR
jgi:hypothetical protein